MIAARGKRQQRLGQRVHGIVQQQRTQFLGQRRAARLARERHGAARAAERLGQRLDVRGLARTINALEGDEQTLAHCCPHDRFGPTRIVQPSLAL
ncbi:hypothetical protein SDC9_197709 [bioreactor metagenome]|uniref:Uncharacterized protein n=1 Tax=bioreactor metagenome TaxID=1076179 RepID=A0A645IS99_9ZZZZ